MPSWGWMRRVRAVFGRHPTVAKLVVGLVVVALSVGYLAWRHDTLSELQLALGIGDEPLHDYEAFYYPMGERILSDPTPVPGFVYGPIGALMYAPFGALPYELSRWFWFAVLLGVTAVFVREVAREAPGSPVLFTCAVAITALSQPLLHGYKFGQVSVLIAALVLLTAAAYQRGQRAWAGALLAFASALKFYPAVFFIVFAIKRDIRTLAWGAAFGVAFAALIPALALGPGGTWTFYAGVVEEIQGRFGAYISDHNSNSFQSLAWRMTADEWGWDFERVELGVRAVEYALIAGVIGGAYGFARSSHPMSARWAMLWLLCATPFYVKTSWPHYFVYLPAVIVSALAAVGWSSERRLAVRVAVAIASAAAAVLATMPFFDWLGDRHYYVRYGVLFWANILAMAALGLAAFPRIRAFARGARGDALAGGAAGAR